MADDQGKGAGKQALAPDVLAARAAEQRERDAAAFAEREYDAARNCFLFYGRSKLNSFGSLTNGQNKPTDCESQSG